MLICVKCGRSAVGLAMNGQAYCEQKTCIEWKVELQAYRALRQEQMRIAMMNLSPMYLPASSL